MQVEEVSDYGKYGVGFGVVPKAKTAPAGTSASRLGCVYYSGDGSVWGEGIEVMWLPGGSSRVGERVGLLVDGGR